MKSRACFLLILEFIQLLLPDYESILIMIKRSGVDFFEHFVRDSFQFFNHATPKTNLIRVCSHEPHACPGFRPSEKQITAIGRDGIIDNLIFTGVEWSGSWGLVNRLTFRFSQNN
jgi:hypothetical protein